MISASRVYFPLLSFLMMTIKHMFPPQMILAKLYLFSNHETHITWFHETEQQDTSWLATLFNLRMEEMLRLEMGVFVFLYEYEYPRTGGNNKGPLTISALLPAP